MDDRLQDKDPKVSRLKKLRWSWAEAEKDAVGPPVNGTLSRLRSSSERRSSTNISKVGTVSLYFLAQHLTGVDVLIMFWNILFF